MELEWSPQEVTKGVRAGSPVHAHLGLTVTHLEPGLAILSMDISEKVQGNACAVLPPTPSRTHQG